MTYLEQFSGSFDPRKPEAALKIALDVLFSDRRLSDLVRLLDPDDDIYGLEGEPGWLLEQRGSNDVDWPVDAAFRCTLDPESYALIYPVYYFDTAEFKFLLQALIPEYEKKHPEDVDLIEQLSHMFDLMA